MRVRKKCIVLKRFRPLIRGFFFYTEAKRKASRGQFLFPSPHSGILFLLLTWHSRNLQVSAPSFGDSFFMIFKLRSNRYGVGSCFRPLIRGFFFYAKENNIKDPGTLQPFPSPHSGILFLCDRGRKFHLIRFRFRPLIRGFFFYPLAWEFMGAVTCGFRPLIRGFFFYGIPPWRGWAVLSGGFRPLIRGFFFYKKNGNVW